MQIRAEVRAAHERTVRLGGMGAAEYYLNLNRCPYTYLVKIWRCVSEQQVQGMAVK